MALLTPDGIFVAGLPVCAVFTGPISTHADEFLSPGDTVEFISRPGQRQTIVRVWTEHDGTEVVDVRDETGRILTVFRSYLRPVLNG